MKHVLVIGRHAIVRPRWAYCCRLGLHQWRLYSLTDLVWPDGSVRQICRRCRKRRTTGGRKRVEG